MKKYILALLIVALGSCTKHENPAYLETMGIDKIVKINLSTNSNYLIADGKSELEFIIRAFYEYEVTKLVDGKAVTKKELFPIKYDKLDFSKFKITCSNGDVIDDLKYRTSKNAGEKITFSCTCNNISSANTLEVNVMAPPQDKLEKINIPIVFHIIYNKANENYALGVNTEILQNSINRLNDVFAAKNTSPYSINSKIEFSLADIAPDGTSLKTKGYTLNLVDFKTNKEYTDHALANLVWDVNKYINVYVYPSTAYNLASAKAPKYILKNAAAIAGLKQTAVATIAEAKVNDLADIGLQYKINTFQNSLRGLGNEKFEYGIGIFYGLLPTECTNDESYIAGGNDVDYCADTYTYESYYLTSEKWIYNLEDIPDILQYYYNSINIMDEYTTGRAISYMQTKRIRTVMENCPLRMMKNN